MSNIDHGAIGRIAARQEFAQNPHKTWPCVARRKCVACGDMIEPGQLVKRYRGVGDICHADCK